MTNSFFFYLAFIAFWKRALQIIAYVLTSQSNYSSITCILMLQNVILLLTCTYWRNCSRIVGSSDICRYINITNFMYSSFSDVTFSHIRCIYDHHGAKWWVNPSPLAPYHKHVCVCFVTNGRDVNVGLNVACLSANSVCARCTHISLTGRETEMIRMYVNQCCSVTQPVQYVGHFMQHFYAKIHNPMQGK